MLQRQGTVSAGRREQSLACGNCYRASPTLGFVATGVSVLQRVTKCWVSGVQSGQVQPQPPPHKSKTILSILWCKVRARIERLNCSIEERERTNFLILTSGMLTSATGCLFFLPVPRASGSSCVLGLSFSYLNLKTIAHH